MRIQDTLSGSEKELGAPEKVRIYLCGVTVYDESHVGHARTVIVFDVLRRYLEDMGAVVVLVQNFTDIDDKIINRAKAENVTARDIGLRYIRSYFDDFDRLGVRRATTYPKATEHINDIIQFIKNLIQRQAAYVTRNGVYFSVSKFPMYGRLSKKNTDELQSGARVTVDDSKDDPLDFALWKLSDTEPTWQSPWGRGRPGWHIECSAMCAKYLGEDFDIHGGGRDLIFPHHENEIAQSESCSEASLAKIWMHVGMVTINGEKMSKSLGNIRSIKGMLSEWGPNVIRLFCLSAHYSKPINYTKELLSESLARWRQAEICFYELAHARGQSGAGSVEATIKECVRRFNTALECDFNTHVALSSFFFLVKETNRMAAKGILGADDAAFVKKEFTRMLQILGLNMQDITGKEEDRINELVSSRKKFRRERQFEQADRVRDILNEMNVELIDHEKRTVWVKKERIKADGQDCGASAT